MNTLSVKFELPTIVASQAGLNLENINQEVKLMFAMFLYEHKRISLSKACEIGGTSQWDFFEANRQLKIPIHLYENPPIPPLPKGGKGGFSCFVEPASGMGVIHKMI